MPQQMPAQPSNAPYYVIALMTILVFIGGGVVFYVHHCQDSEDNHCEHEEEGTGNIERQTSRMEEGGE